MKLIHTFSLIMPVIALTAVSCSREIPQEIPGLITVTASIDNYAKASAVDFEEGDNIGLYIFSQNETLAENIIGTKQSDGSFDIQRVYWPESGSIDILAYYPWYSWGTEYNDPQVIFHTIYADQSNALDFEYSDLMTASAINVTDTERPVHLVFKHAMSLVDIRLIPGEGLTLEDLEYAKVTIPSMPTQCYADIVTGEISEYPWGQSSDITPHGNSPAIVNGELPPMSAVLVPQTIPAGTELLKISTGNMVSGVDSYSYITPEDITLVSGYRYQMEITLVPASVSATARMSVSPR